MNPTSGSLGSIELNLINQQHPINIPSASHAQSPQPLSLNRPRADLLDEGRREEYLEKCFPLHKASLKGDWEAAKDILNKHKELVRFSINGNCETALHVAVSGRNTLFVENLVRLMENVDLELRNNSSNTALCLAAVAGHVEMAKIMVNKNKALLDITGSQGKMPLYMAALSGKHDMVKYLYDISQSMAGNVWTHENQVCVLLACVEANLFDVALQIMKDRPELAKTGGSVLRVLARKPQAFRKKRNLIENLVFPSNALEGHVDEGNQAIQLLRIIWTNILKLPKAKIDDILRGPADQIKEDEKPTTGKATTSKVQMPKDANQKYSSRVLFVAAEMGNTTFILELIHGYPEQVQEINDNNQSIFHVAVSHRHRSIYHILYKIGSMKDSIITLEDENGNNMLHLVGILRERAKNDQLRYESRVVQQMQQELLWFKEVEALVPPSLREKKNAAGLTPRELFTKSHKSLVSEGKEWMKKISSELMVVAALIATISFAAAITFAGGYIQNTGVPVLIENKYFEKFVVCNAISFLLASTSIFLVLSIVGSRYDERDFFVSLHYKLLSVITTLSMSLAFMMAAFSANFFILYHKKSQWIPHDIDVFPYMIGLLSLNCLYTYFGSLFHPSVNHYLYFRRKQSVF